MPPHEIIIECSHYRKAMIVKNFSGYLRIMLPSINSLVFSSFACIKCLIRFRYGFLRTALLRTQTTIKIFSWLKVILIIRTTSINSFPPFHFFSALSSGHGVKTNLNIHEKNFVCLPSPLIIFNVKI